MAGNYIIAHFNRTECVKPRPNANLQQSQSFAHLNVNYRVHFQKEVLDDDRRRAVSDEAKRLYTEEPNLFAAANKEYEGNYLLNLHFPSSASDHHWNQFSQVYFDFSELPADARLHDLSSLMAVDAKKMDVAELGENVIKAQQAANLKHSSSLCAIIPEDRAQTMLAGVSAHLRIRMRELLHNSYFSIRTWFIASNRTPFQFLSY